MIDTDVQHDALVRLEELVRIETPTGDADAIAEAVGVLTGSWRSEGFDIRETATASGPVVVADLPGAGRGADEKPVLFVAHIDTVWPRGTIDAELPWHRADGIIRGPGVYDMKSGIVAAETAVRLARAAGGDRLPVRIFVAVDEETGSVDSAQALRAAAGGCGAAIGLESPHPDGALKVGRFGSTRALLSVGGRRAHAALDPQKGISATEELIDQLLAVRELVAAASGDGSSPVLYNLGALEAPGRANVVNDAATALLGFRFPSPWQEDGVLGALEHLEPERPDARVAADIVSRRPAWEPRSIDHDLARRVAPAGPAGRVAAGAADTNGLAVLGIPVVDGAGPRGGGAHALSEHIVEQSLWDRIELLHAFLRTP